MFSRLKIAIASRKSQSFLRVILLEEQNKDSMPRWRRNKQVVAVVDRAKKLCLPSPSCRHTPCEHLLSRANKFFSSGDVDIWITCCVCWCFFSVAVFYGARRWKTFLSMVFYCWNFIYGRAFFEGSQDIFPWQIVSNILSLRVISSSLKYRTICLSFKIFYLVVKV